ncbi:hypothetical protein D1007_60244 [Hordeum vulgare]|uniref:uncharacterized protein LOC123408043 n=1 Tax=Hordeum vulgare subsp. vulgare TaxID=112509 RepID=UPI001D1A40DF|nr:uncharacterized protein LOC123408043 [Hordeum vulgare subsp. vulgare]KAE8768318.1 hypothetical protein D1007_60244 [Hordeum vulgare]
MAAEVLVGSERRVLISSLPAPPPPDSLLGRLDQIDLRLRQLEEERRPSSVADGDGPHPAPRHQHSKSMPSALQPQDVRGTLMDRLNLLESRIRQLSCELDLDGSGSGKVPASSLPMPMPMPRPAEDCAWSEPPLPEPMRARTAAAAAAGGGAGASWSAVQILQRGARQLNRNKPIHPAKVKKLKEAKCACEEEKRKAERGGRPSAGRRWFTVGC